MNPGGHLGAGHITGRTKIMFILGDPVAHIVGTALFNQHFRERGLDASAFPLQVSRDDLAALVAVIRKLKNVAGFGVTIPHKIGIVNLLDRCTRRAELVGAANFVRREADGDLVGDNVDGVGFIAGLARNGIEVAGKRVLQTGAGGVGRAIAFALAEAGAADLVIANRTPGKAESLVENIRPAFPRCRCTVGPARASGFDLVVNATSLGMHEGDALPVDVEGLAPPCVVAEVIMAPETTPLLAEAARRGCPVVAGREMLLEQLRLATGFLAI